MPFFLSLHFICHPASRLKEKLHLNELHSNGVSRCLVICWAKKVNFVTFACDSKFVQSFVHILISKTFFLKGKKRNACFIIYVDLQRVLSMARRKKYYTKTWHAGSIFWKMCSISISYIHVCNLYASVSLFNYYQMFQMLKCYALCTVCALVSCTFQNPNIYIAINLHEIKWNIFDAALPSIHIAITQDCTFCSLRFFNFLKLLKLILYFT